jgi:hypothetical protein
MPQVPKFAGVVKAPLSKCFNFSKCKWERIDRKSGRVRWDLLHNAAHAAQVAKHFNPLSQRQHIAAVCAALYGVAFVQ